MLSIVIPAREEEKVICKTVSRLKQLLTLPKEIIVSDDGSTDATVQSAKGCADKVVEFEGTKHTASRSRNAGAELASGDFIVFLDADSQVPEPDAFFTRALKHFDDPHVVGVCWPQRAHAGIETWADYFSFGVLNITMRITNNILHRGEASGKFMIVRASAFRQVGGFREKLVTREDGDFFLRLSHIGRTIYDPKLMIFHGARRAHRIGWWKLWRVWIANSISVALFDEVVTEDWTPVR